MTNKEKAPSSQENEGAVSPVDILLIKAPQGIGKSTFLKLWMSKKRVSK